MDGCDQFTIVKWNKSSDEARREILRLGMLVSQEGVFDFSGFIPTIEIALETIQADKTLPFTFTYTHNDSMVSSYTANLVYVMVAFIYLLKCQAAASVRSFIGQVFSSSIGADCSVATEPVAEISHNWNLVQVRTYIYV